MEFVVFKPPSLKAMARAVAVISRLHAGDHTYLEVYDDMIKFRSATGDKSCDCTFTFGMHFFDSFNPGPRMRFDEFMVVPTDVDQLSPTLLQRVAVNARALSHAFHLVATHQSAKNHGGLIRKCTVKLNLSRWCLSFQVQRQNFSGDSEIEISVLDRVELPVILRPELDEGQTLPRYRLEAPFTLFERFITGFAKRVDAVSITITDGPNAAAAGAGGTHDACVIISNKLSNPAQNLSRQSSTSSANAPLDLNSVADQVFVTSRTDFDTAVAPDATPIKLSLQPLRTYLSFAKFLSTTNKNVTVTLEWNSPTTPVRMSVLSNNAEEVDFESELAILPTIDRETVVARGRAQQQRLNAAAALSRNSSNRAVAAPAAAGRRRRGGGTRAAPREDLTGSRVRASAQMRSMNESRRASHANADIVMGDVDNIQGDHAAIDPMPAEGANEAVEALPAGNRISSAVTREMRDVDRPEPVSSAARVPSRQPAQAQQPTSSSRLAMSIASQRAHASHQPQRTLTPIRERQEHRKTPSPPPPPSASVRANHEEVFEPVVHLPDDFADLNVADELLDQLFGDNLHAADNNLPNETNDAHRPDQQINVRVSNSGSNVRTPQKSSAHMPPPSAAVTPSRVRPSNNNNVSPVKNRSFGGSGLPSAFAASGNRNTPTPHRSLSNRHSASIASSSIAAAKTSSSSGSIPASAYSGSVDASFIAESTSSQAETNHDRTDSQLQAAQRNTIELLGNYVPLRRQRQYEMIEQIRWQSDVPGTGQAFMLNLLREFVDNPQLPESDEEEEFLDANVISDR